MFNPPYLDVEPFFDAVITRAGGYRVDSLIPQNRPFDNADYYFESEGVFAELKVLQHDADEDERLRLRLITVYQLFARGGQVPPLSPTQRFTRSELLPIEAQLKLLQPLKRRLQSPVKKAAKQLKETKQAFNREKDIGLLVLVNEGSALFDRQQFSTSCIISSGEDTQALITSYIVRLMCQRVFRTFPMAHVYGSRQLLKEEKRFRTVFCNSYNLAGRVRWTTSSVLRPRLSISITTQRLLAKWYSMKGTQGAKIRWACSNSW